MGKKREKERNIELLLEQRKLLITSINEQNNHVFMLVIAIIPALATLLVSYSDIITGIATTIIRYIVLEVLLLLSMVICACLFAANNDRDYITAIDIYLFEKYGVSALFYQGELGNKHITGTKGVFVRMTTLIGVNAVCFMGICFVYALMHDISFYCSNIWLLIIMVVQIIAYIRIVLANIKRKHQEDCLHEVTQECLTYLRRTKDEKKYKVSVF